jgi:hypothetical protein
MERLSGEEKTQGDSGGRPLACACGESKKGKLARIFSVGWSWLAGPKQCEVEADAQKQGFHDFTSAHFERGAVRK